MYFQAIIEINQLLMLKVSTSIRSSTPFRLASSYILPIYIHSVLAILFMRKQFKIIKPVILSIKILMIDLKTAFYNAIKSLPYTSMNRAVLINAIFARSKVHIKIRSYFSFNRPKFNVAFPSFAMLDRVSSSNTCFKKSSYNFKSCTLAQQMLSFSNLMCCKQFAPSCTANITLATNFIKSFVSNNRFPKFHTYLPFKLSRSIA